MISGATRISNAGRSLYTQPRKVRSGFDELPSFGLFSKANFCLGEKILYHSY